MYAFFFVCKIMQKLLKINVKRCVLENVYNLKIAKALNCFIDIIYNNKLINFKLINWK